MEKFSKYNDPLSGINPFVEIKKKPLSILDYLKAILKIPLVPLLLGTRINVVQLLVRIKSNKIERPKVLAANASSLLDIFVLKYLTGIKNFYYVTESGFVDARTGHFCVKTIEPCVLFPEGCRTNNRAVLQFARDIKVDHVCGIKYSKECIDMYGNPIWFILRLLASGGTVDINFRKSNDLSDICKLSGLPQVKWASKDKDRFVEEFVKKSE
ncbi:uncharacterized protein Eint_080400 [Encephalitozoon intestinalis ATCC 50506]|uniref:Uncharacterized protein n=1 Tax=Encephalitozoon intestinalis (strain ATCC 50506) TaxID=876142 RepID=E0S8I2_ENCIT|nr:uncharacterized protein Eint_080400 [Encephalitozoon intestinalis ATCC 50506]ADM11976.1 hypothetical protein Eint_080400 [Encephalitozoon intestinalis ATCC 50506]UTX45761.1 hypothetical protein GPK93_08g13350 [Encephalitozoon intestinalis]